MPHVYLDRSICSIQTMIHLLGSLPTQRFVAAWIKITSYAVREKVARTTANNDEVGDKASHRSISRPIYSTSELSQPSPAWIAQNGVVKEPRFAAERHHKVTTSLSRERGTDREEEGESEKMTKAVRARGEWKLHGQRTELFYPHVCRMNAGGVPRCSPSTMNMNDAGMTDECLFLMSRYIATHRSDNVTSSKASSSRLRRRNPKNIMTS